MGGSKMLPSPLKNLNATTILNQFKKYRFEIIVKYVLTEIISWQLPETQEYRYDPHRSSELFYLLLMIKYSSDDQHSASNTIILEHGIKLKKKSIFFFKFKMLS